MTEPTMTGCFTKPLKNMVSGPGRPPARRANLMRFRAVFADELMSVLDCHSNEGFTSQKRHNNSSEPMLPCDGGSGAVAQASLKAASCT
ncbi:hypothetical protein FHS96_002200 [Sphingomonas zeicaulis]|uniref:hypothetical protein n=1 Tax=Sphingomonas zeicaulis TaxID=1632740 RepID=UPI003D1C3F29